MTVRPSLLCNDRDRCSDAGRFPSRRKYQRPARGSVVDAVEPQIRELLAGWPQMPATVIAERIGWTVR